MAWGSTNVPVANIGSKVIYVSVPLSDWVAVDGKYEITVELLESFNEQATPCITVLADSTKVAMDCYFSNDCVLVNENTIKLFTETLPSDVINIRILFLLID